MKILLWNVNGIRAAIKKDLKLILESNEYDIICLQEVKANLEQTLEVLKDFPNYTPHLSVAEKKGYSGVLTLTNKIFAPINFQALLDTKNSNITFNSEGRFAITKHSKFDLYNIYFPSGTSGEIRQNFKYDFLNFIYEYFKNLDTEVLSNSILCGDFNICHQAIDIHHPKQAEKLKLSGFLPNERKWFDKFLALNFSDCFRLLHPETSSAYTWWSYRAGARIKNLGWRIDYFLVGSDLKSRIDSCKIMTDKLGSDHAPLFLDLTI